MRKFILKIFLLSVTVLALTGCAPNQQMLETATLLEMTIRDQGFSPYHWAVPAGELIDIEITNQDVEEHTIALLETPWQLPIGAPKEPVILWEVRVPAGERMQTGFTAPLGPGEYDLICTKPGHAEAGEVGILIVVQQD